MSPQKSAAMFPDPSMQSQNLHAASAFMPAGAGTSSSSSGHLYPQQQQQPSTYPLPQATGGDGFSHESGGPASGTMMQQPPGEMQHRHPYPGYAGAHPTPQPQAHMMPGQNDPYAQGPSLMQPEPQLQPNAPFLNGPTPMQQGGSSGSSAQYPYDPPHAHPHQQTANYYPPAAGKPASAGVITGAGSPSSSRAKNFYAPPPRDGNASSFPPSPTHAHQQQPNYTATAWTGGMHSQSTTDGATSSGYNSQQTSTASMPPAAAGYANPAPAPAAGAGPQKSSSAGDMASLFGSTPQPVPPAAVSRPGTTTASTSVTGVGAGGEYAGGAFPQAQANTAGLYGGTTAASATQTPASTTTASSGAAANYPSYNNPPQTPHQQQGQAAPGAAGVPNIGQQMQIQSGLQYAPTSIPGENVGSRPPDPTGIGNGSIPPGQHPAQTQTRMNPSSGLAGQNFVAAPVSSSGQIPTSAAGPHPSPYAQQPAPAPDPPPQQKYVADQTSLHAQQPQPEPLQTIEQFVSSAEAPRPSAAGNAPPGEIQTELASPKAKRKSPKNSPKNPDGTTKRRSPKNPDGTKRKSPKSTPTTADGKKYGKTEYENAYREHMGEEKQDAEEETAEQAYRRKLRERADKQQKDKATATPGSQASSRPSGTTNAAATKQKEVSRSSLENSSSSSSPVEGSQSYDESEETNETSSVAMPSLIPNAACMYPVFEPVAFHPAPLPQGLAANYGQGTSAASFDTSAAAVASSNEPPTSPSARAGHLPPTYSEGGASTASGAQVIGGSYAYGGSAASSAIPPPPPPPPGGAGSAAAPNGGYPPPPPASAAEASQQHPYNTYPGSGEGTTSVPGTSVGQPYPYGVGAAPPPPVAGTPVPGVSQLPPGTSPTLPRPGASPGGMSSQQGDGTASTKSPTKGGALLGMGINPMYKAGAQTRSKQVNSSKIDPMQIPRPVNVGVLTSNGKQTKTFATDKYVTPPNITIASRCVFVDKGSCSARFIRMTCNQIPVYHQTADCTHVPIAAVVQPFAALQENEAPITLVDNGADGPLRCPRCKVYVNPYFSWVSSGKEAHCNFCGHYFEVPKGYFSSLDYAGNRRDRNDRAELCTGTVDYVAPVDYYALRPCSKPQVPFYLFVLEVTRPAMDTGYVHQVMSTIRSLIPHFPGSKTRVAIMTFDSVIHCYHFGTTSGEPAVIIQTDVDEPDFACASPDALFVDPRTGGSSLELLLDLIPTLYHESLEMHSCAGAALTSAISLFKARGGTGQIMLFMRSLPTRGVGLQVQRDDVRVYSQDDEWKDKIGELFLPQNPAFHKSLVEQCLDMDVCVDAFLLPAENQFIDVATQSHVPNKTGGDVFFYPAFNLIEHGEQLHYDISRHVLRRQAFGCSFKMRTSRGLTANQMYAAFDPVSRHEQSQFEVSRLSADSSIAFVMKHEDLVENAKAAYVQVACLYTNFSGVKCIRVHTLALSSTNALSSTFRYTCVDTLTNVLVKETLQKELQQPNSPGPKTQLVEELVHILYAYRVNCASTSSYGQLILPESLKLLPLYVSSMFKQASFRRQNLNCRVDTRVAEMCQLMNACVTRTNAMLYPRVIPLHRLQEKHGLPADDENVHMPTNIQCSMDRVSLQGLYLYENGERIVVYVGPDASPELLSDAFGVSSIAEIEGLTLNKALGARIFAVIQQIRKDKGSYRWMRIQYTNEDTRMLLVEDALRQELSYVDFLCMVHRKVQTKLESY